MREDPNGAAIVINDELAILRGCLKQMKKNGYLDDADLVLLKSVPGTYTGV
jgi:hypothetical protein